MLKEAKAREWNAWIENDAVEICKKAGILTERTICSKWVLTIKKDGAHKARLCAVGYKDPDLTKVYRDASYLPSSWRAFDPADVCEPEGETSSTRCPNGLSGWRLA